MAAAPIRVLVVDDSAFARKVLRETLSARPELAVVGSARDGLEALERIAELRPDVVTLDLVMPNLDGLGVLRALPPDGPRVVVVSMADEQSDLGVAALQAGAVELVHKPTALATDRLYELADELVAKVTAAAHAHPRRAEPAPPAPLAAPAQARKKLLLLGASTGGPQALTQLLKRLPASFPVPIAIVLHMPVGYTAAFAARLDQDCALTVVEAREGLVLRPGLVVIARAGTHLKLHRDGGRFVAHLDARPMGALHVPSADVLFASVADGPASDVLAVVLTGMGDDGVLGAAALERQGGTILTEAESSCVVWGMPRSVREAGLSTAEAPIASMAELILKYL